MSEGKPMEPDGAGLWHREDPDRPDQPYAARVREASRLLWLKDGRWHPVRLDGLWRGRVAPPGSPTVEEHAVVVAERDWLRRALAVERGDESEAPEGWQHGTPGSWHHNGLVGRCGGPEVILRRYGGDDEAEGDLRTDWQRSPKDDGPREAWPFALEAMLAITAEHEARKGGEGG